MSYPLIVVLLVFVASITAFYIGRASKGQSISATPAPEVRRFGLAEVEAVASKLGGLTPQTAAVVNVAAIVGGMEVTVATEAADEVDFSKQVSARLKADAEALRQRARTTDEEAASHAARATSVAALVANFS